MCSQTPVVTLPLTDILPVCPTLAKLDFIVFLAHFRHNPSFVPLLTLFPSPSFPFSPESLSFKAWLEYGLLHTVFSDCTTWKNPAFLELLWNLSFFPPSWWRPRGALSTMCGYQTSSCHVSAHPVPITGFTFIWLMICLKSFWTILNLGIQFGVFDMFDLYTLCYTVIQPPPLSFR